MSIQFEKVVPSASGGSSHWTFFSNHAYVLFCLVEGEDKLLRDVAFEVGITERAVHHIIGDLETAGILLRFKEGRCNRYKINRGVVLRDSLKFHRSIGDLYDFVNKG